MTTTQTVLNEVRGILDDEPTSISEGKKGWAKRQQAHDKLLSMGYKPEPGSSRYKHPKTGKYARINDVMRGGWSIEVDIPSPAGSGKEMYEDVEPLDETRGEQYEAAAKMLDDYDRLVDMLKGKLDRVEAAFKKGKADNERMKKVGGGRTEAVTFLKPALAELRKFHGFLGKAIDHANKATGLKEDVELNGMSFTQQGNGLWEEPVVGKSTPTPSQISGASPNVMKSVNALMNAKKGKAVKMGGVAYKVTQAGQPFRVGSKTVSVLTLGGAYGGGRGDQYALLLPSGGPGATIKLVNIASSKPVFRDLNPDLTVEDDEGDLPLASMRTDSTQVWTPADLNEVALIVQAVYRGDELSHHTEEQERDPEVIKAMRRAVREGIAIRVEGTQVPVHEAARVLSVYDGLGIPNQAKLAAMGINRMLEAVDQTLSVDDLREGAGRITVVAKRHRSHGMPKAGGDAPPGNWSDRGVGDREMRTIEFSVLPKDKDKLMSWLKKHKYQIVR